MTLESTYPFLPPSLPYQVCDQVRRLDRQISYGGSVHVQEMGYLARSFMNSAEGKAIAADCEARVVKSGVIVDKHRKMDKVSRLVSRNPPPSCFWFR